MRGYKGGYKHFFVNIGTNSMGMDASMCVVSRLPIVSPPRFIPSRIKADGDQKWMYRGYFIVETKKCNYLYAHLHPKETEKAKEIRKAQLDEIRKLTKDDSKPWVILGDLNIDRNKGEYGNMAGFIDSLTKETMTCEEDGVQESIDYVVTRDDRLQIETKVDKDLELSDHSTIIAIISLAKK